MNVKIIQFPQDEYFVNVFLKNQIILHHTSGWDNGAGVYEGWKRDRNRRGGKLQVATCSVLDQEGTLFRGFHSKFWAHHIGSSHPNNLKLNQQSIGIEVTNWGGLKLIGDEFRTWVGDYGRRGKPVLFKDEKNIIEYTPEYLKSLGIQRSTFHDFEYFEKYTDKQIESLREFLIELGKVYSIPLEYKGNKMWQMCNEALNFESGLWTHVSYMPWGFKSDMHPQPELIQMLNSL